MSSVIKIPQYLETARLTIRPYQPYDLEAYLAFMLDEEATRYLNFTTDQRTPGGVRLLFQTVLASYGGDEPICALAIARNDTNEFIGSCGLAPLDEGIAECYYSLLPRYRGLGYATEAVQALLDYAFVGLGLREVRACVNNENSGSVRLLLRVGMTDLGLTPYRGTDTMARTFSLTAEAHSSI